MATSLSRNRSSIGSISLPGISLDLKSARHFLLQLVDLSLAGVVFAVPLFMGGRHPLGRMIYFSLVSLAATAWCARQTTSKDARYSRSGAEWLLVAGAILILMQLVPLPHAWIQAISPQISDLLPLWNDANSDVQLGTWRQISLTPHVTRGALVMYLAHAMLFLVVVQRVQSLRDIERILRWLAIAAAAAAVLGLAQYLFGNGKFLWVYQDPFRDTFKEAKASFSNPNHFAHFLALGTAPLIWWLTRLLHAGLQRSATDERAPGQNRRRPSASGGNQSRRRHRPANRHPSSSQHFGQATTSNAGHVQKLAVGISLGLVLLAGMLSYSRGGAVIIAVAFLTCVGIYASRSLLSRKTLLVILLVGVFAGGGLGIYGYQEISTQLRTLTTGSLDDLDHNANRRKLWAANLTAAKQFLWLGTGGGSQREVYPIYFEHFSPVEFTHTENGYLQTLLEYGIAGLALLTTGIALCFFWGWRALRKIASPRHSACAGAIIAGLVASVLHSAFDFVWYVPACMAIAAILCACLFRLSRVTEESHSAAMENDPPSPKSSQLLARLAWPTLASMALLAGVFMVGYQIPSVFAGHSWDRYLSISLALDASEDQENLESHVKVMMPLLAKTLEQDPNNSRAHLRMAAFCIQRFEFEQAKSPTPIPLSHIRDAVAASGFSSAEAADRWLDEVLGQNRKYLDLALRHAGTAARLCPLHGEAYTYLAALSFLDRPDGSAQSLLIDQALRVRPHDASILLQAGATAMEAGDRDTAMKYWKRAFHHDPRYQQQIIEQLAPRLSAQFLLDELEPDLNALMRLYQTYHRIERFADARIIAPHYLRALRQQANSYRGDKAAMYWRVANNVYRFLGDRENALRSARNAVKMAPSDMQSRQLLAQACIASEEYEEALQHVKWCHMRKPHDEFINKQLDYLLRTASRRKYVDASNSSD